MENPFTIRHYAPEKDLSPLARMLTEIESIDRDGENTSEENLRAALAWPNYRPDQDVWVAEIEGKLLGYGVALEQPSQHCTMYVVVHPSHRRKGLGSQLLELTLNRVQELGSTNILVYANDQNAASNFFLKHHGFAPVGSSGAMKAPASIQITPFEFPPGFTLKRYSKLDFIHLNINKKQGKLRQTLVQEVADANPASGIYHDVGSLYEAVLEAYLGTCKDPVVGCDSFPSRANSDRCVASDGLE